MRSQVEITLADREPPTAGGEHPTMGLGNLEPPSGRNVQRARETRFKFRSNGLEEEDMQTDGMV